jgi:hypothetical protein
VYNLLDQTLRYAVFALLAILGPGWGIQRLARVAPDRALVIPLGTAAAAAACWIAAVTGLAWLFPAVVALLNLALFLPRRPLRPAEAPSMGGALPAAAAVVLLLAATQYPWNRLAPSGEFLLDPLVPQDTAFHVGLTRELAIGYPPQVPGVSGFPLGYHLGLDLVRAAAWRFAGVDPYHAISRFDVTLGALALLLALRAATRAAGGAALAVALAPWTLLATDFSFVFAGNPQAHWWTDLLRGNVLLSMAVANPIVPALALALGALVALARHEAGEGRGWLALAALQAAAVPFFKVFLGAHLLLGLGLALPLARGPRRAALAALAAPCAVATAALVFGQGGQTLDVALAPLDLVRETREILGLDAAGGPALALWALVWLAASLGLRMLGVPAAIRAAAGPSAPARIMAFMALSAWPLGLLFRVSAPRTLPGQKPFNDAYVLIEQGGPLLWIFTVIALAPLAAGPRVRRVAVIAAAAALSLPSTLQFVRKKAAEPPDPMPAGIVRAMAALSAASRPGEVVLQRPGARYPPPPLVLAGRRVPYERFTPFMAQFVAPDDLERRHEAVYRFFRTHDRAEAIAIARSLDARYLCLYGPDRVRFDTTDLLVPIHEEPQARCYSFRTP